MGKRANQRNVILPTMILAEIDSDIGLQNVSIGGTTKKVILPKMSLADMNCTLVYKTSRLEEQQQ